MRIRSTGAALVAGVALAGGLPPGSAATADAAIRVTTTDGRLVVSFPSLSCRVDKSGFHARKVVRGWRLVVRIFDFSGFHSYPLEYGDEGDAAFFLDPPGGGETFGNGQEPTLAADRLSLGGGLRFPSGRRKLWLAFPITYDSQGNNPNIVRVVGTATCTYPRRGSR